MLVRYLIFVSFLTVSESRSSNEGLNKMNDHLDALAYKFFREFARCEYSLKAAGILVEGRREAMADWIEFSRRLESVIEKPTSPELKKAVEYFLSHPPKKQINGPRGLTWDVTLPDHKTRAELILLLVCRVRNNLFHGGKFNGQWFEPERSDELLSAGLIILSNCVAGHAEVRDAYEGSAI